MIAVKVISYGRENGGTIRFRLDHIDVIETFGPSWGSADWRMVVTAGGVKHAVRFACQEDADAAANQLADMIERRCIQ